MIAIGTVALGIVGLTSFDTAFEVFHELFFPAGSFLFDPSTDRLVQLFPETFWVETTIAVGVVIIVLSRAPRLAGPEAGAGRSRPRPSPTVVRAAAARGARAAADGRGGGIPIARDARHRDPDLRRLGRARRADRLHRRRSRRSLSDPTLIPLVQLAIGIAVALLFLASVVAHELAHALVGRRRGVPTTSIVLGFIGGLAPLSIQAATARDELVIAVAGPLVSFVLGAVLVRAGVLVGSIVPASAPIAGGVVVVGVLNLILGVLSVLPAMPLDGGRVVRAFAWSRHGDRDRAYRTTARVGRMIGWTILGAGVALVLADLVTEGLIGIALGWLLNTGARTVERRLALEQLAARRQRVRTRCASTCRSSGRT